MFRGDQFLKMLTGTLAEDPQAKAEMEVEFKRDYPFGDLTYDSKDCQMTVQCKRSGENGLLCMKCGNPMINRVNQKFDRKSQQWVPMKTHRNFSNWECPTCDPGHGSQVIMAGGCVGK